MIPVCSVGPLLEYIEKLELKFTDLENYIEYPHHDNNWQDYKE